MLETEKLYVQYKKHIDLFYSKKNKSTQYEKKLVLLTNSKNDLDKNLNELKKEMNLKYYLKKYPNIYDYILKKKEEVINLRFNNEIENVKKEITEIEVKIDNGVNLQYENSGSIDAILEQLEDNQNLITNNMNRLQNFFPNKVIKNIINIIPINTYEDFKNTMNKLPKLFNKKNSLKNQSSSILKFISKIGILILKILLFILLLPFSIPTIIGKIIFGFIHYYLIILITEIIYNELYINSIGSTIIFSIVVLVLFLLRNHIMALAHLIKNSKIYYLYINKETLLKGMIENYSNIDELEENKELLTKKLEQLEISKKLHIDKLDSFNLEELSNEEQVEIEKIIKEEIIKEEIKINKKIEEIKIEEIEITKELEKINKDVDNQYKKCIDMKSKLNSSIVKIEDTKGCLSDKIYILSKQNKDEIVEISTIEHNFRPTVFLYNLDESVKNVSSVLTPFIKNVMEGVFRVNAIYTFDQHIVDTVSGIKELQSPDYKKIITVYEKTSHINDLVKKIESNVDKIISSGKQSIKNANMYRFENGNPVFKYQIVYFIIPPIESFTNSNIINQDLWRLMQSGDKYGFIPFFFIKESEWDIYLSNKDKKNNYLNQLDAMIDKNNIYTINLTKQTCTLNRK